jgi:hypothetical protein
MPNIEQHEPRRAKLRKDRVDPKSLKSNTDSEEPKRETPQIEKRDPRRDNPLKDIEDPRCKKSNTDSADPMRAKLLKAIVDPS